MANSTQNKGYLHGAAILAGAVAIVKLLGAVFRIPLGNILGDEGMSTFTVAHSIYALLLTLSTAGLPVALSKLISSAEAVGDYQGVRRTFAVGRNTFVFLGVISFFIMAIFSRELAALSNAPTAALGILALSPAMLFVCLISAYRGYFQGFSNMVPTSISQIIEALSRLFLGLGLAWYLASLAYGDEYTVAGAIFGVTVGTALSAGFLFICKRRANPRLPMPASTKQGQSTGVIFKDLLRIAVPLTLGASIFSIVHIVDNVIILGRLQDALGMSYDQARSLHGTYAMTMSLFNLPSSFVIPLTVALIPAISAFLAKGDKSAAKMTAESGMRITCLLALPAGVGLFVLARPIMYLMYYGRFAAEGPQILAYMGLASFFLCLFQATNCILQAYGFQRYTLYTLTIGGVVKVGLNWVLLSNPEVGIYGAAISTLVCYVVISLINMALVKKSVPNPPRFRKVLLKPFVCTLVMGGAAWAVYDLLAAAVLHFTGISSGRTPIAIATLGAIAVAGVVYLILIIATKALTLADMEMLPKGKRLAKILRIR